MKSIESIKKSLSDQLARSIDDLGSSAKGLDWFAGNLFPQEEQRKAA